jgi:hypothetical protein
LPALLAIVLPHPDGGPRPQLAVAKAALLA